MFSIYWETLAFSLNGMDGSYGSEFLMDEEAFL